MGKSIKILAVSLTVATLFSCSGVKNTVVNEKTVQGNQATISVANIDEKKQKEFEYLFVEALKQKVFGNIQKSVQLLSGCLEIDPNSSAAMFELAKIYAGNNDLTSSSLLLEKAVAISPQNKWYKILLSKIYQQQKKFIEADQLYVQLLKDEPDNLEYLFTRGMLLTSAKKFKEALAIYDQLEKKTGLNEQIAVTRQELYLMAEQPREAFREIQKLIDSNPSESKYYGLMADLYLSQGDEANALKYYNKILEMDPKNGFVHFSLANMYLEKGNFEESFSETKKGFENENIEVQTKLQLFLMLTSHEDSLKISPEKEDELIKILLEKHPDEYLVHTMYAESLLRKEKPEEARKELLIALDMEKNDYQIWERVLFIDNELQDWKSQYSHSQKVIELFPNQPMPYFMKAISCFQLEKYDETISAIDEGLEYVVDNNVLKGRMLMIKGEAFYKKNNRDEAFKIFDKSVELDPSNETALNNYAYYLSLTGNDLDKAERMSGKVIAQFPDNPTFLDTHAWVLFKKGDYQLAKFYMDTALKQDGEKNSTLLEHYGDILLKLGKTEDAIIYYEKAKKAGSESKTIDQKIKLKKYIE